VTGNVGQIIHLHISSKRITIPLIKESIWRRKEEVKREKRRNSIGYSGFSSNFRFS
jgi:hypothetical protein